MTTNQHTNNNGPDVAVDTSIRAPIPSRKRPDLPVVFVGPPEIEVRIKPQVVKAEHSDTDVFLAAEHAVKRAARSVSRAIEAEALIRR